MANNACAVANKIGSEPERKYCACVFEVNTVILLHQLYYYYALLSSSSGYVVSFVLLSACVFRHQLQLWPVDPWERDREREAKGEKSMVKGGRGEIKRL